MLTPLKLIASAALTLSLMCSLTCSLTLTPANAETSRVGEARAWLKRGEAALAAGHLREALVAFEAADRYIPDVKHKMMIAKVHEKLGGERGCTQAIATWRLAVKQLRAEQSPLTSRAQAKITELEERCLREVSVRTKPEGAKVWINAELMGQSPINVKVKRGAVRVEAELNGQRRVVELAPDQKDVTLTFKGTEVSGRADTTNRFNATPEARRRNKLLVPSDTLSTSDARSRQEPIHFTAKLSCQTRMLKRVEALEHCQSRLLWEGDQFKFSFQSDQSVYLYVFLMNDVGQRQMLFPYKNAHNRIPAHRETLLPHNGWFKLDNVGPTREQITVIYSRSPVPALENLRWVKLTPRDDERDLPRQLASVAMRSTRGVSLETGTSPELSPVDMLEEQTDFIGEHEINSVTFGLLHQGARPQ